MRNIIKHLTIGDWSWGFELYKGKPMLFAGRDWYDGWHYALHLGPLWINCDY